MLCPVQLKRAERGGKGHENELPKEGRERSRRRTEPQENSSGVERGGTEGCGWGEARSNGDWVGTAVEGGKALYATQYVCNIQISSAVRGYRRCT